MKKKILIIVLFFKCFFLLSQEVETTSDFSIYKEKKYDSLDFKLFLKKGVDFRKNKNKDSAFYFLNKSLLVAKKLENNRFLAQSYYELGVNFEVHNNYKSSIENYEKAIPYYKVLNDKYQLGLIHNYIGFCYTNMYAEDRAITHYLKSLNYFKDINNEKGLSMDLNDIGNLYYDQANYPFARKYFLESLKISEKLNDSSGIATTYTNLGNAFFDDGEYEKGMNFYHKSIAISRKLNDEYSLAVNYNNLGDSYIVLKDYDKARFYFSMALKAAKDVEDVSFESIVFLNIADVQNKSGNYRSSIANAEKGLEIVKRIGKIDYELDFYENLAIAYEGLKDYKKSIHYYKIHDKLRDSIFELDKLKKVNLFHKLNELEEQHFKINELAAQNEIANLKVENEKKFINWLVFVLVIFGVLVIVLINQQTAKKKAYNLLSFKNHQINKMNDEIKQQSEFLKQINNTKDRFFSIIAHDLKNPFNSIKGFTELLIENDNEYDKEKRLKFLRIIKGSTTRASNLLENLLIWANSQTGNVKFNPVKVNLRDQVASVFAFLEIQAINKDIELENNIDNHVFIEADKNMIDTIFRNLVSNAIKFTQVGGKVSVSVLKKNGFIEIVVKDNGVGISENDLKNLFSIDVKSSNVGTANEQGSGLGLILCKEFVERHGGTLRVESELNTGSKFIFTIPSSK